MQYDKDYEEYILTLVLEQLTKSLKDIFVGGAALPEEKMQELMNEAEENIPQQLEYYSEKIKLIPINILADVLAAIEVEPCEARKYTDIYLFTLEALYEKRLLEKSEIHSKDFDRDIEKFKKKVDDVSKFSDELIKVILPIKLSEIKSNFYGNCSFHLNLPEKLVSALFKAIFNTKLHKGDIEKYKVQEEKNYKSFKLYMDNQQGKKLEDYEALTTEILKPNRYYIGNPE